MFEKQHQSFVENRKILESSQITKISQIYSCYFRSARRKCDVSLIKCKRHSSFTPLTVSLTLSAALATPRARAVMCRVRRKASALRTDQAQDLQVSRLSSRQQGKHSSFTMSFVMLWFCIRWSILGNKGVCSTGRKKWGQRTGIVK